MQKGSALNKEITVGRAVNWDALRALAMFLVLVTHAAYSLGPIGECDTGLLISSAAIICDPIFFALSGYFAIRALKRSLKDYYLNKVATIILPLFVYSIVLYLYSALHAGRGLFIGDYFIFFADHLSGAWWFIPALVPCLVAAPFIAKGFEALSDRQVFALGCILAALFAFGAVFSFLRWACLQLGVESLSSLCSVMLNLVPPSMLTKAPQFFELFILGGIFRRLAPYITKRVSNGLIACGFVCWVIDVSFALCNISRSDPSFFWLFVAIGAMALCERVTIRSHVAQCAISWAAMRSYSIYLLNLEALGIANAIFYDLSVFGVVATMAVPMRILMWAAMVLCAYGIALVAASLIDIALLKPAQRAFRRLCMKSARSVAQERQSEKAPHNG